MKLSATGSVLDYFTPFNESVLNSGDVDLGSSSVLLLPDSVGTPARPHLMIATGKPGKIFLLDQADLGKFNSVLSQDLQEVDVLNAMQVLGGVFGTGTSMSLRCLITSNSSPSRAARFRPRRTPIRAASATNADP